MSDETEAPPPAAEEASVTEEAPAAEEAAPEAAPAAEGGGEANPEESGGEAKPQGEGTAAEEEATAAPAQEGGDEAKSAEEPAAAEVPAEGGEAPAAEEGSEAKPAEGGDDVAPAEEGETAPAADPAAAEGGEAAPAANSAAAEGGEAAPAEGGGEDSAGQEGVGEELVEKEGMTDEEKAALKIQQRARGMQDRKMVAEMKEKGELPGQKREASGEEVSSPGGGGGGGDAGFTAEVEAISEAAPQSAAPPPHTGGSTLSGSREIEVDMGRELPPVRITLEVQSQAVRKPFFGGFRHKITGVEYHHANCQTEAPPRPQRSAEDLAPPKYHRDTQTKKTSEKAQQAVREHGTQMPRDDHYEDVRGDYVIEPRPYLDSEQWSKIRLKATNVIQCYTRGMFARSLARKFKAELEYNRQYYLEMQVRREKEMEETREREIERRIHPKSAKDFEVLYKELEAWRVSETQKIEVQDVTPAEKQVARYQLLLKEVKLVQTIDKLKSSARKENDADAVSKLLADMSRPKLWEMSDGAVKEVQTPFTIRAKELSDLYQGLSLSNLRVDERLDVLLHVKWTVKEFDTKLTRELVELIDREADLLNRGRSDKALEGLRKRTLRCFLQFVQNPTYNPEVANFPEAQKL